MTSPKKDMKSRRPNRGGFGFSGFGLRALMALFNWSAGVSPQDRRGFQGIFGQAITFGLVLGCTTTAIVWFGFWLGLIIGPITGMLLAGWWMQRDSFFD